jgi:hypothetical protein
LNKNNKVTITMRITKTIEIRIKVGMTIAITITISVGIRIGIRKTKVIGIITHKNKTVILTTVRTPNITYNCYWKHFLMWYLTK